MNKKIPSTVIDNVIPSNHDGGPYDMFARIEPEGMVFKPYTRENITQAFLEANLDNPEQSTPRFEKAKIISRPVEWAEQEFKVWEESPYTFNGEYWINGWSKRDMTPKEKLETQINNEVSDKKDRQIMAFLKSKGFEDSDSIEAIAALNAAGPEYVFSLDA